MTEKYLSANTGVDRTITSSTLPSTDWLRSKEVGNLHQLVLTRWQKKTMSQYLLPEGFIAFCRSAVLTHLVGWVGWGGRKEDGVTLIPKLPSLRLGTMALSERSPGQIPG